MAADLYEQALLQLGDSPDAGDAALALSQRYSYVYPEPRALALITALSPIVEIGAGTGYWASRLRSMGADILAFDQAPPDREATNRYHPRTSTWTDVQPGDHTMLGAYPERTLFLCWPPLFSALGDCLSFYRGDTVAYIGDNGHRTAQIANLAETFRQVASCPVRALDPDPTALPVLSIWKRTT